MKYKIKLYIGGHLSMITYRTDTIKNVLSCARKAITLFSECDERVKICILDSDGNGIMSYVTGNKPKPVYTAIDHVTKERKTYYTGAQKDRKEKKTMKLKLLRFLQILIVVGLIYDIVVFTHATIIFG